MVEVGLQHRPRALAERIMHRAEVEESPPGRLVKPKAGVAEKQKRQFLSAPLISKGRHTNRGFQARGGVVRRGCTDVRHARSRTTLDPRIPAYNAGTAHVEGENGVVPHTACEALCARCCAIARDRAADACARQFFFPDRNGCLLRDVSTIECHPKFSEAPCPLRELHTSPEN